MEERMRRVPERWVDVAAVDEIPVGERKVFEIEGDEICVFNIDGEFYAIDNACPHARFPLSRGHLTDKIILCPFHCWDFDLETGKSPTIPGAYAVVYPTRIINGRLELEIEETRENTPYNPPSGKYR